MTSLRAREGVRSVWQLVYPVYVMASFAIFRSILEKMENPDPDFRFMAASDLHAALGRNGVRAADSDTQRRLCMATIKLLQDSSSEVQGLAQRCLPPLSRFVEDRHAVLLVEELLNHVLSLPDPSREAQDASVGNVGLKSLRDVASLGLTSIINDLPTDVDAIGLDSGGGVPPGSSIANHILPRLLDAIKAADDKTDNAVLTDSLQLLASLLKRMAPVLFASHEAIRVTVLPRLGSHRMFVCKRATTCLALLAPVCSQAVFDAIVVAIVAELRAVHSREKTRTAVHAIWALSKTAGQRLSKDLPQLVPILFAFCSKPSFEDDDELREHCLQTLESFVGTCPNEMTPFSKEMAPLLVTLARYDPNYAVDEDDEDDDNMRDGDASDGDDDFDDEDDFSDDDDASWKVRRAAVKCIHAIVCSTLSSVTELYSDFALVLVSRFKEHEETVKLDVFAAFIAMLQRAAGLGSVGALPFLSDESLRVVRAARKELCSRSVKTRISAMGLLRELVAVTPMTVGPLLDTIVPEVYKGLADSSAQMKTESLLFLYGSIAGCGAEALYNHVSLLVPRILETAEDRYYKITAESFRLCSSLVTSFGTAPPHLKQALVPLVATLHDASLKRLTARDQDSEVKEACIECVGATVALYGSDLGADRIGSVSPVLCDRLNNEVTRLPAVRAFERIAESQNAAALEPVMEQIVETVGGFLRKSNRPLRLGALHLLAAAPDFSAANDAALLENVSALLSEDDLRLAALSLKMCSRLTRARGPQISPVLEDKTFHKTLRLMMSPLLQGRAVDAVIDMFRALAEVNSPPLTVNHVLSSLRKSVDSAPVEASAPRVAGAGGLSPVQCVAKCVAVVCEVSPPAQWSNEAASFIREVEDAQPAMRAYALACLGELGRRSLLGGEGSDGKLQSQAAILAALDAPEEGVKSAAAVALGGVASGNGAAGIPSLVELVRSRSENRYLLLLSLRDAISFSEKEDISNLTSLLLRVLLEDVSVSANATTDAPMGGGNSSDEATRFSSRESVQIATAECLGLLTQLNPTVVLPELSQRITHDSVALRSSVVAAVKFVVSTGPADLVPSPMLAECLKRHIGPFFVLARDPDVNVRKNTMQTVNAIARGQHALLAPHLDHLLPALYEATAKNPHLVRMVDLGPFKYEEDFGLDLRKSAFDTMRTLIGGPLAPMIPLPGFLERVVAGLNDQVDVRSIAQLVLGTMVTLPAAPAAIICVLDETLKALDGTLSERLKDNAVRQEQDRHEESLNGALRAVRMLESLSDVQAQPGFIAFMKRILNSEKLNAKYDKLRSTSVAVAFSDSDAMRD